MTWAGIERIEGSDLDVIPQLTRLKNAGADTLLMVGNVGPSAQGSEIPRPHGLGRAGGVPLGPGGWPFQRAGRPQR